MRARVDSETTKYRPGVYEKRVEEHSWMISLYKHWGIKDHDSAEMIARRYVERLFGCIENVVCKDSVLTLSEQKSLIRQMLYSKTTRSSLKIGKPRSLYMKIMWLPLKWRLVWLTLLEGYVISFVKAKSVKHFAKLKANR